MSESGEAKVTTSEEVKAQNETKVDPSPSPAPSGSSLGSISHLRPPSVASASRIGRLCSHQIPKAGPPPRDSSNMSRESDDLSSMTSGYTDQGAVLTVDTEQFIIGQKVWVGGIRPGQIAFIGETHFAPGEWAGIVLDEPNGKNDGCVAGKRYFQCEPKRGIFSRLTRLTTQPLSNPITPTSPMSKNSPERSRTGSPTASIISSQYRSPSRGLTVGDRVIVSSGFGSRAGILRYLGLTQFASGNWCGVELDEPTGKNDGSVDDIRYFVCKPKYGIFVPIAKVSLSPSSKKSRIPRSGSRESLTSIGTMNSVATTNTSRLRMNAQRKSISQPKPVTPTKTQFSMQDLLREKQNHIEKLMIERDLDREDTQNQALQYQRSINELKAHVDELEKKINEERKAKDDLQLMLEEATFCSDELTAQTQVYREKIQELEQSLGKMSMDDAAPQALFKEDFVLSQEGAAQLKTHEELVRKVKELEDLKNSIQPKDNDQISKLINDNQIMENKVKELETAVENSKKLNEELQAKIQELLKANENLSKEKHNIENAAKHHEDAGQSVLALLEEEKQKSSNLEVQLQSSELIIQQLQENVSLLLEKEKLFNEQQPQIEKLYHDIQEQKDLCSKLKTEASVTVMMSQNRVSKLETDNKSLKNSIEELEKMLQSKEDESLKQEEVYDEKLKELKATIEGLESVKDSYQQAQKKLEDSENKCQKLEEQLKRFEDNSAEQNLEVSDLKGKFEALTEKCKNLESQNESLQKDVLKARTSASELQATVQKITIELEEKQNLHLEKENQSKDNCLKLEASLEELQQKLEKSEKFGKSVESSLEETKTELEEKLKKLKESEEKCAEVELKLFNNTKQQESLQSKYDALMKENKTLENNLMTLRSSSVDSNEEVVRLSQSLQQKQKAFEELIDITDKEKRELESHLQSNQQRIEGLNSTLDTLCKNLEVSKEESAKFSESFKTLEESLGKKDLELSNQVRQWEALKEKYKNLENEKKNLQEELNCSRASMNSHNENIVKLTEDLTTVQKSFQDLTDQFSDERLKLKGCIQDLEQQLQASKQEIETLKSELLVSKDSITDSTQQFETFKTQLVEKSQKQLEELKKEEQEKRSKLTETFEVKIQSLEKTKSELDDVISKLQAQIHLLQEELLKSQLDFKSKEEDFQRQLATSSSQFKDLQMQLTTALMENNSVRTAYESLQKRFADLELQVAAKDKQLADAKKTCENLQNVTSDLGSLQAELVKAKESLSENQLELEAKDKLISDQTKKIEELKHFLEELQKANSNMAATNAQLSEALQILEHEKCETANIFEIFEMESDQNAAKLIEKISEIKAELSDSQKKLEDQAKDLEKAKQEIEKLKGAETQAQELLQKKEQDQKLETENLNKHLVEVQSNLKKLENEKLDLEKKLKEVELELVEYKSIIDEIDDEDNRNSISVQNYKKELELQRGRLEEVERNSMVKCSYLEKQVQETLQSHQAEVAQLNEIIHNLRLLTGPKIDGSGDTNTSTVDNGFVSENKEAHVNFLNSIIADMHKKNDELKERLDKLQTTALQLDSTQPDLLSKVGKRKPAPRVYCDICEIFDQHETEDCPLQASEDYSPPPSRAEPAVDGSGKKERKIPEPRKYCEDCEVFGHEKGECNDEECY